MSETLNRRSLLGLAGGAALSSLGEVGVLSGLRPVSAEEARVTPEHVRFRPEIEPLVKLVEETPRERLLERVGEAIRGGESYQRLLSALMLAGVRNIKPRPVGFKFHAVLVVNSAHQASLASPDSDRWLPLLWAFDAFKGSQAQDVREGDWTMSAVRDANLPAPAAARGRFIEAMDRWDESAADASVAQLARTAGAAEIFELFWRYGARDFRDIGHKAIYVANAWRTLQVIGWEHAEPVLRSLAFALLQRGRVNPADADEPADRPWRRNLERAKEVRDGWASGQTHAGATRDLLAALRQGSPDEACDAAVAALNRGLGASAVWDAVFLDAGELLMRQPGILGIHCVTSANALRYAAQTSGVEETRKLMLLQAAAFMALFRESMEGQRKLPALPLDQLAAEPDTGKATVDSIYAALAGDRADAARKTLAYLSSGGSAEALMVAARRLLFAKGRDSHDYKFSSAALEDYYHVTPEWRSCYLASAMYNLKGTGHPDNPLAARARAALKG